MAIVENRSTEIGDVIRIQTNVPIIGVVSLNMFTDDTEGESFGMVSPVIIPPFDQGSRRSARHFFAVQSGIMRYGIINSVDGSNRNTGIAALNVTTQIWDTNYPENTIDGARRLVVIGDNLYVIHSVIVPRNSSRVGITRLNLVTRTWTVLNNLTFLGQLRTGVEGSFNNRLYFFTDPITIALGGPGSIINPFYRLHAYDIALGTYSEVTTFPLVGLRFNPATDRVENQARVSAAAIDEINGYLYVSYTDQRGQLVNYELYRYDLAGDVWSTTAVAPEVFHNGILHWNRDDELLYTIRIQTPYNIFTFNPTANTWNTEGGSPPVPVGNITSGNNRIYGETNTGDTLIYNPTVNTWGGDLQGDRFFTKRFRYSIDGGLTFTPFIDLTDINVQNIVINEKEAFVVDVAYQRTGSETAGDLTWNSTTLLGQFAEQFTPIYDSTIFKTQFEALDVNVLNWALNVLEKMYQRGLLPDYIDRNREGKDDTDFIAYWFSITHLFAILVYWMRLFENIPANRTFVTRFLENFDVILPFDLNLTTLGIIYTERVSEYRKRGTPQIQIPTADVDTAIDGELLRLIDWHQDDFFFFALTESSRFGWCIGLSSPTWTSTAGITNLIMGYEFTIGVEDLTRYPLVGAGNISIVEDVDVGENVMSIAGYAGIAGTYGIDTGTMNVNREQLFPIDHSLDYEIAFKVKKIESDVLELQLFAYAYDAALNLVNMRPVDGSSTNVNSFQANLGEEFVFVQDTYYRINLTIHGSGTSTTSNLTGNIRDYRGLRFPVSARYLGLRITVDGTANRSDFYLYDIKIRVKDLPISQGLFGVKNIIAGYMDNNGELNNDEARRFIQERLIPYNSFLIPRWLDPITQFNIFPEFVSRHSANEINLRFTVSLGGLIVNQDYFIAVRSFNQANREETNDFNVEIDSGSSTQQTTLNIDDVLGTVAYTISFSVVTVPVGFTAVFNPALINVPAMT